MSLAAGGNGTQAGLKKARIAQNVCRQCNSGGAPLALLAHMGGSIGRDGRGDVDAKIAGLDRLFSENRRTEPPRVVCTPPIVDAPGRARAVNSAIADEDFGCHPALPSMEIDRAS